MKQDIHYALRALLQHKGWTAVVVLSLAFGIGANTTIFSAVNGLFLRTLPVRDPHTLVRLRTVGPSDLANNSSEYGMLLPVEGQRVRSTFSYPIFEAFREANRTLTALVAGAPVGDLNVVVDGQAELASAYIATGNYFQVLGVEAVIGRMLMPEDDEPGAPPAVVISEGYWNRRFGAESSVLGSVIRLNNVSVTVVGVIPAEFTGVERMVMDAHDLTLPLTLDSQVLIRGRPDSDGTPRLRKPTWYWLQVIGRLRPGVTIAQVEGNFAGVFQGAAREGLAGWLASQPVETLARAENQNRNEAPRLRVSSAARGLYDTPRAQMRGAAMLSVVAGLILLIVCANVANLLLSRAAARQRELSVRLSLGATRLRLVRQLLTESVLVALVGGGAGAIVALWGRPLLPNDLGDTPVDWRVLAFTATLAVVAGLLFGIVPALRATSQSVGAGLKDTSRTLSVSRTRLGQSLLVVQIAISLVLLVGAGLFLRTVSNLQQVDVGFNSDNLVLAGVDPELVGYDPARAAALYTELTRRLQAVPGVRAVTWSNPMLLTGGRNTTSLYRPGEIQREGADIHRLRVAPNFFDVMEIPLVAGRGLTERDGDGAPLVAVINEAAVRKFFSDGNPVGRTFGSRPEDATDIEVVGVVRDARYDELRDEPPPTMYVPFTQYGVAAMFMGVRTTGDPGAAIGAVREAVRQVEPNLPLMRVTTQTDEIQQRLAQERLFAQAGLLFGGLALLVASIGLFGLMSYSVARRTHEIGIRMALGAGRETVVRMIMRESLILAGVGVVIGIVAALGTGRLIASQLFGVAPVDVTTFLVATLALLAVSAVAGYWPARRASRVDPTAALQHE